MAAPAEISKKRSNFLIRQFKEKCHFNIAANLTLNTMVSFIILLIACTARIACADRHTYIQTHTHETTTVTLAAHARQGLIMVLLYPKMVVLLHALYWLPDYQRVTASRFVRICPWRRHNERMVGWW